MTKAKPIEKETPKGLVISALVDWDAETAADAMVTFVGGDNPIKEACAMIDELEVNFPNHEYWICANDAACQIRAEEIMRRHGWDEGW